MEAIHSLLRRQLRRYFGNPGTVPEEWQGLIKLVNEAYYQFDDDREMIERSLDLSSKELIQANANIRTIYERIITSSVDGIFTVDMNLNCTVWNPGMEKITNTDSSSAINQPLINIFPQFKKTGDVELLKEALTGKITIAKESSYLVKSIGQRGFFESHFSPLRNENNEIIGGLAIIRNITEHKRVEQALSELTTRDTLTHLYNRKYFNHRLKQEISQSYLHKSPFAVLLCDLDQFKFINEDRSYAFGDDILKAVAKSIQASTRGIDLVFRWGGDEFVVLLLHENRQEIVQASLQIRKDIICVGRKFQCQLDISIGIALYPEHGENIDELILLAGKALRIAKERIDKVNIGEDEYHLDEQAVLVALQPIVDIKTGEVLAQEALCRDVRGKLSAEQLFKKYEMVGKLGELKEICFKKQIKTAVALGLKRVFVNVDFELLERLGCPEKPPKLDVILEISEREALNDVKRILKVAQYWRKKGYKFAIDDFGAGFISLPFIARLVPEYVKLDRMTILDAVSSLKFRKFLNYMILALRNYSKKGIIAEGIETEKELKVVKKLGVHLIQGHLLGKPEIVYIPKDQK